MENNELPIKLDPEGIEQQKQIPQQNEIIKEDNFSRVSEIATEISEIEKNIEETKNMIDDIRNSLRMPQNNEIPPSIQMQKDSLEKLNQEKENFFEMEVKEGETDFGFLCRLTKFLIDKQKYKDSKKEDKNEIKIATKKKDLYNKLYQDKENEKLIKEAFIEASNSINSKEILNNEENKKCLVDIRIGGAKDIDNQNILDRRKINDWEHDDFVDFFSETNQRRSFFPSVFESNDGYYYSGSLFHVYSSIPEAKEYLKKKLDGKTIYFLGGGTSANDLLQDDEINPKHFINIDPFISEEEIERNKKGLYQSIPERADSKNLLEEIKSENIELADEIWASYSVPYYNRSPEEINNLFNNIKGLLKEGGNCRITPLGTQNEQSRQAILNNLKALVDSREYNIHLDQVDKGTLIIHKLENPKISDSNQENQIRKNNPNSIGELLSIGKDLPTSPDKVYRSVGNKEAIDDIELSGIVRNKQSAGLVEKSRWGERVFWSKGAEGKYHSVSQNTYVIEAPLSVVQERIVTKEDVTAIYTKDENNNVVNILK